MTAESRIGTAQTFNTHSEDLSQVNFPLQFGENKRYQIKKKLGSGSNATVYLVRDMELDRNAALKVVNLDTTTLPLTIAALRFKREAQLLIRLQHPYIVKGYEFVEGKAADGSTQYGFLMEDLSHRQTLREFIATHPTISDQESAHIFHQIVDVVSFLRRNKIAHYDLKPDNIVYGLDDKNSSSQELPDIKLTDFGLSNLVIRHRKKLVRGTAGYFAPELFNILDIKAQRQNISDERGDVYSVAIILLGLVFHLFPADLGVDRNEGSYFINRQKLVEVLQAKGVPEPVTQVFIKATQEDLEKRFSSLHELEAAYRQAKAEFPTPGQSPLSAADSAEP